MNHSFPVFGLLMIMMMAGIVLFAIMVPVAMGKIPVPQGAIWGTASTLSRYRFAAYFGALGLSFGAAMNSIIFFVGSRHSDAVSVAVPAGIAAALLTGWAVMIVRAR
ncbi:hypothetical protein [Actinoplanes sp. NBRC 101535]|uniref:hypothetical protein n=1 Tax=Actinoplanes sp. NBRC 101535 TaxID=3032196 RepID=UPI0024A0DFBE|nr:hypothetical protein [Actinoplanes sp. NBRC 101535]GLY03740.1 hypothetical protein Acsp01_41190 [Actinoplanes sp. NBRC 101535]